MNEDNRNLIRNRVSNTSRNVIWGITNKTISILLPFLTRTILIHKLGVEYVGISSLFSSILEMLSLAELGFASAIIYSMYEPLAIGDKNIVCCLLSFYRKIYRIIGIIIVSVGVIIIPFVPQLISGNFPLGLNLYLVYIIYLFNTAISYFLFAYKKSLLTALQRNDIISKVTIIIKIIMGIVQICTLILFSNYYCYIIVIPLMTILDNLMCAYIANKYYSSYQCKGNLSCKKKADIIEKSKGLLIHKICGITRNSCDNIFISIFLGITSVGIYSNYYYIMISIRGILDVFSTSMSASIGNSVAIDSIDKNYNDLNIITFIFEWMCGWCTICLLCLYQPFMKIWVGSNFMFPMPIVVAICIYFYVWTMGDIKSQYADAKGLWWKDKFRTLIEAFTNILLNWVLVQYLKVFGIVIATTISLLFVGFPWGTKIVFDNYFIGKDYKKYFKEEMIYASVTVFNGYITYYLTKKIYYEGIIGLIVKFIICLIIPNIIYWLLYSKTYIFKKSYNFLKIVISKMHL